MARDHRLPGPNGSRVNYSCGNRKYCTNVSKGYAHRPYSPTLGSVLEDCLFTSGEYSLWLEHVTEISTGQEVYWLMWYDAAGVSTMPMSGVFDRRDLEQMISRLARFVP